MAGDTVLVTTRSFSTGSSDVEAALAAEGLRVVRGDVHHDRAALGPVLRDAVAWIAGTAPVTAGLLAAAPRLRIVARYGVGVDAVDVAAATERGIVVTNTPGANSESVADLALTLLMNALRTVRAGDAAVRRGDWSAIRGREIASLRIGVVGFGRIGRAFAARAVALGAAVLAFDPYLPAGVPLPAGVEAAGDLQSLAACDAVSLHAPGGVVIADAGWLSAADGLVLVNTARADLVDEAAVAAALREGRLGGYAADTLGTEGGRTAVSPLLAADLADRVTITPHLGAQTVQAIDRMGEGAVRNVLAVLAGNPPLDPVTPTSAPTHAPTSRNAGKVTP